MHHVAVLLDTTIKLEDVFDPSDEPYPPQNIYSFLTDRLEKLLLLVGVGWYQCRVCTAIHDNFP